MPNSPDYKRGYGKGYTTGRGDQSKIEQRHQDELFAVAQRAERAEIASGVGHCEDCAHWKKLSASHAWGICTVPKAPGTPYGCWAQAEDPATRRTVQISTSPTFGCVLFLSRTHGVQACSVNPFSSRACELGTKGCTVTHGVRAAEQSRTGGQQS